MGLPKNITHDGQTRSIRGWAKHLGLGESALRYRINAGWSMAAVLSPKRPKKLSVKKARNAGRMIEWNGETLCVSAWAIKLGVKRSLLHYRLAAGWSVDRVLTGPSQIKDVVWNGRAQSIAAWAREVGMCRKVLARRLRDGWEIGKALMQKTAFRS